MKKIVFACVLTVVCLSSVGFAKTYQGKKILFVDSYHEGYNWSDGILKGIKATLKDSGVELKVTHMDTKRNGSEEFKQKAGQKVKQEIETFKPDVVIAADDNASQYVIVPYFKGSDLPFVFCGVNWDASVYGFPCKNVTGMVEVTEIDELAKLLKGLSKGSRIGFIADDTETNRKEVANYKAIYHMDLTAYYAKTFDDFKKGYGEIQNKVDYFVFYGWAAIQGWNPTEAADFIAKNTKIPSGTFQEEVMPYVMIGYLKVPEEQGTWATGAALKILDGAKAADIPIVRNKKGNLMINVKLAEKAGVQIPFKLVGVSSKGNSIIHSPLYLKALSTKKRGAFPDTPSFE